MLSRRGFLRTAGIASAGAALGLYSWQIEPHWLEITRRRLPIRGLPDALRGRRLVHLSDLHIGHRVSDHYLLHSFERVTHLNPDVVVFTGDFITFRRDFRTHTERILRSFPLGSLGTFAILGNHDYAHNWHHPEIAVQVAGIAERHGIRVLRNQVTSIQGLQILGFDDLWAGRFDLTSALRQWNPGLPTVALTHNPDTVDLPGWEPFRGWILGGHTHGGQVKPPFLPPPLLPVRNGRYTAGEFTLTGGRRLYISRGVGHLRQVRFNVRPEVTEFVLESEAGSSTHEETG